MFSLNPFKKAGSEYDSELQLVKKMLRGDEHAFTQFYQSYAPKVFRFCKARCRDEAGCQDIVQQTLANAMRYMHSYRAEASLLTWLCQIARKELAKWYAANGQQAETLSVDADELLKAAIESLPASLDGAGDGGGNDAVALVHLALDSLPTAYGDVLEMKYIEGLSVKEIAARIGSGETAVQSLLARARTAFKTAFTDLHLQMQAG